MRRPRARLHDAGCVCRGRPPALVGERHALPLTAGLPRKDGLRIPISPGEGNYFADPATLSRLEQHGQVVFRYCRPDGLVVPEANPNGSINGIAGIVNREGNVLGMMPPPERCAEPALGGTDGLKLFRSVMSAFSGVPS